MFLELIFRDNLYRSNENMSMIKVLEDDLRQLMK